MFSTSVVTLEQRAAFIDLLAARGSGTSHELDAAPAVAQQHPGQIVMVRANRVVRTRMSADPVVRVADPRSADLGALAAAFVECLQDAGMALTPQQAEQCVDALQARTPPSRRTLYYLTRAIFVTDASRLTTFNRVFAEVFGAPAGADRYREHRALTGATT